MSIGELSSRYTGRHVVYAIQRADGAIKLGYTHQIHQRVSKIKRKQGAVAVLGIMDGAENEEAEIHAQFAALNIPRFHPRGKVWVASEWFSPAPELIEFIRENMEQYVTYADEMRERGFDKLADRIERQFTLGKHTATPANEAAVSEEAA